MVYYIGFTLILWNKEVPDCSTTFHHQELGWTSTGEEKKLTEN